MYVPRQLNTSLQNKLMNYFQVVTCKNVFKMAAIQFWFMVFNATFNNISVISWRSVLLVEETGIQGENHRPAAGWITFC
jgi:hypothetical protein